MNKTFVKTYVQAIDYDKYEKRTDGKKGQGIEETCRELDLIVNSYIEKNKGLKIINISDTVSHSLSREEKNGLSWDGNGIEISGYVLRSVLYEDTLIRFEKK